MANVLLNGDVAGVTYDARTWGELLDVLDEHASASGEVVVAVRVGGVDVPEFRAAQALPQPLDEGTEVVVETIRPAALIRQTLAEAEVASQTIIEAAVALGGAYRASNVSVPNRNLPEFAESLGGLIVLTSTVAQGAGVDLSVCIDGGLPATAIIATLIAHMDVLLAAQRAGDWAQMADVIEFDIAAALRRWPMVLEAIRQTAPALAEVA